MTYIGCKYEASPKLHGGALRAYARCRKMPRMTQTYLKQWRKYRGLTQEDVLNRLAVFDDDKLPQTGASLSRIENGKQIYTQRTLEALADVYQCSPHELLGRDPTKEGEIIDMLAKLGESQIRQIRVIVEALAKDAS